jgi:hypothetical protein
MIYTCQDPFIHHVRYKKIQYKSHRNIEKIMKWKISKLMSGEQKTKNEFYFHFNAWSMKMLVMNVHVKS